MHSSGCHEELVFSPRVCKQTLFLVLCAKGISAPHCHLDAQFRDVRPLRREPNAHRLASRVVQFRD